MTVGIKPRLRRDAAIPHNACGTLTSSGIEGTDGLPYGNTQEATGAEETTRNARGGDAFEGRISGGAKEGRPKEEDELEWEDFSITVSGFNDDALIAMIAYLDESGNSTRAETLTISGVIARSRDWKRLQKHWPRAMRGFVIPYHHTDILNEQSKHAEAGDVQTVEEYDALQRKLIGVMSSIEYYGFGATVVRNEWDAVRDRVRKSDRFKDPWFMVFETAIGEIMHRTEEEFGIIEPINFVFDRLDSFSERATHIYEQIKCLDHSEFPFQGRMGTIAFATELQKRTVHPLQAVDLFVYEANRFVREVKVNENARERWQWGALVSGRPKRAINGKIWRPENLDELATLVEESHAVNLGKITPKVEQFSDSPTPSRLAPKKS